MRPKIASQIRGADSQVERIVAQKQLLSAASFFFGEELSFGVLCSFEDSLSFLEAESEEGLFFGCSD